MNKLLSVSVAAYNVEATLREALDPFLACVNKEKLDVIIVDDGSKDETTKIAREYVEKAPSIFRLIQKENGGWGSTLNSGIKASTGKYFKQLDGDDYFSVENLDDFLSFLETSTADMVYSPFVTFDDSTHGIIRQIGAYSCFPEGEIIYLDELTDFCPAMHDLAVRTELLQKNGIRITEHCFYTDVEYVLKTYNACYTMQYYSKPIYYYRIARDGQSMSLTGVRKHYKDHQKMLITMLEYYNEMVHRDSVKEVYARRLMGVCNMQYAFYMALPCSRTQKKELMAFDAQLCKGWPYFYNNASGTAIAFLRKHHFWGYSIVARLKTRKDKRLKRNIFER